MTGELRTQFMESMRKEWQGWLDLKVCSVVEPEQARFVPKSKIVPSRFVHTDKNEMLRDESEQAQEKEELPILAKSRLVAPTS